MVWRPAAEIAGTPRPLRGLGPGHKPAFDEAVALVGCADRQANGRWAGKNATNKSEEPARQKASSQNAFFDSIGQTW
jgi:hypothetical protein